MKYKKVFSLEKFVISNYKGNWEEYYESYTFKHGWPNRCNGLTREEMIEEQGCNTSPDWMILVPIHKGVII